MRLSSFGAAVLAATLLAPGVASADVFEDYQDLSQRRLSPAPLVFTKAAAPLSALDKTVSTLGARRRNGYGLRLVHYGPDAVIAFTGGNWKTLAGALREQRRFGFKVMRTRIRGHAGYALKRGRERDLLWSEGGRVYWMGSATPKTVSARELRLAAAELQPLGGVYAGSPEPATEADTATGATAILTGRTISLDASWGANCTDPGGTPNTNYGGDAHAVLVPLDGHNFSVDTARSSKWSGTVSGTTTPGAITLSIHATGTFSGNACTAGPVTFTLIPVPIR